MMQEDMSGYLDPWPVSADMFENGRLQFIRTTGIEGIWWYLNAALDENGYFDFDQWVVENQHLIAWFRLFEVTNRLEELPSW